MKSSTFKTLILLLIFISCQKKDAEKEQEINDSISSSAENKNTVSLKSLANLITEHKELSKFTTILHASNTMHHLNNKENYTVFIPTDLAFENSNLYPELLKSENKKTITNHIIKGSLDQNEVMSKDIVAISGKTIKITYKNNIVHINDIPTIGKEIKASNGSLFIIEKVIQ